MKQIFHAAEIAPRISWCVRRRLLLSMAHPVRRDDVMTSVRASHVSRNAAVSTGYIRVYMQERIMEFIHTTASTVEKLKRLAKQLRKSTKSSLAVALDAIARQHGYAHWKHVTVCLEKTAGAGPSQQSLPSSLLDILDRAAASDPASAGTQQAFGHGFVFAMDVKDADAGRSRYVARE